MRSTTILTAVPCALLLTFSQIVTFANAQYTNDPNPEAGAHVINHGHGHGHHKPPHHSDQKPNFLVFLTDDQDRRINSLDYQPLVQKYLRDQGTEFTNYFTTTAMCCPSRVSLWSGQFAHNHNVTDESPPH
ncbi:hypothetical protein BGZ95_001499, partial [Linnemannia exigua]